MRARFNGELPDTLDPLNFDQWEFYVLPSVILKNSLPQQQRIGLSSLLKLNPFKVKFGEISSCISKIALTI